MSRRIQRVVVAAVVLVLAGACTDSTDTVATDSIVTTTASSAAAAATTSSSGPLPVSTETTAEGSSATTSTSGVPPDEIDAAIQEWVDSYCISAQELGTTLGPDDVGETRDDLPMLADAARDLSARYEELATLIDSDLELTTGEFRDRSERSAHDLHAAADQYTSIAAAIDDEPVRGELEALIDHHHDVEIDALEAAGLFLLTPLQLGYDVPVEFSVPVEVTDDPGDGEGSSPGVTSRLGAGEGCPFILQLSIPNCADEPAACSAPE